jgi:hypothetical protein
LFYVLHIKHLYYAPLNIFSYFSFGIALITFVIYIFNDFIVQENGHIKCTPLSYASQRSIYSRERRYLDTKKRLKLSENTFPDVLFSL